MGTLQKKNFQLLQNKRGTEGMVFSLTALKLLKENQVGFRRIDILTLALTLIVGGLFNSLNCMLFMCGMGIIVIPFACF